MADNVTANAGSGGATFASDDISSVQWPFVKLAWGPRDTANEVDKASGKSVPVQGEAAHDAATTGNPVLVGAEARTSDGTPVTHGDAVRVLADTLGKQVVLQGATHDLQISGTTNYTSTSAASVIAAGGSGVKFAVTSIVVTNGSTSVNTKVNILDGTTVMFKASALASGGGFSVNAGGRPLFVTSANSTLAASCTVTGADVDVSIGGYKYTN